MPRVTELTFHNVDVEQGEQLNRETGAIERTWTIVYQCQRTGDLTRFTFFEPIRDYVVEKLMGGIVLAHNGDVPTRDAP